MDISKVAALLGCEPNETAITAKIQSLVTREVALTEAKAKIGELQDELSTARASLVTHEAAHAVAECKAELVEMRSAGLVRPNGDTEKRAQALAAAGNLAGLKELRAAVASVVADMGGKVPTGKRQSAGHDKPAGGNTPAPRNDAGEVDYEAIADMLPPAVRSELAAAAKAMSWATLLQQASAAPYLDDLGIDRSTL